MSFQIISSSESQPRSGISGSYGSSVFRWLGSSMLLSIVAAPIYTPTQHVGGFPLPCTLCSVYSFEIFVMIAIPTSEM